MSDTPKTETTEPETTETKTLELTPVVFLEFVRDYSMEFKVNPVQIPEDALFKEGQITVNLDDGFVKAFNKQWENENLEEALQKMIEVIVHSYIAEEKTKEEFTEGQATNPA